MTAAATTHGDPTPISDCLFCRIVAGEIPSRQIYADADAVAFLDVEPLKRGHTLVIPRTHVPDVLAAPEALAALVPALATTGRLLQKRLGASGMNMLSNVGADAGQSVFHLHVHLVPRYAEDPGLGALVTRAGDADLDRTYAVLTA
ncbi:MAG: HIT family protein [Propioniciclava sp.]